MDYFYILSIYIYIYIQIIYRYWMRSTSLYNIYAISMISAECYYCYLFIFRHVTAGEVYVCVFVHFLCILYIYINQGIFQNSPCIDPIVSTLVFTPSSKPTIKPPPYRSSNYKYTSQATTIPIARSNCKLDDYNSDMQIGECMQRLHVLTADTRDIHGAFRFNCFPISLLQYAGVPHWYDDYSYFNHSAVSYITGYLLVADFLRICIQ